MEEQSQQLKDKIQHYQPSEAAIEIVRSTPLLCIAGIAGAGKNTVVEQLLKTGKYHLITSHTTRVPRTNNGVAEINGVDYHFIDPATAEYMIDKQGFIEIKGVHTKIYGTSVGEFVLARDEGKIAIAEIDIQGVDEYLRLNPATHPVFLVPPDPQVWLDRLKTRYLDGWEAHRDDILIRFTSAQRELQHVIDSSEYHLIVNKDIERTLQAVRSVVEDGGDFREDVAAKESTRKLLNFLASGEAIKTLE